MTITKPKMPQPTAEETRRSRLGKRRPARSNMHLVATKGIVIPPHRKPDPDLVLRLAASIPDVGLLHPIILTPRASWWPAGTRSPLRRARPDPHQGAHRDAGMLERELAQIDENMT